MLTDDQYQDAITLTHAQKLAFNAFKRAVARCDKEEVFFYQVLDTVYALNGYNVFDIQGGEDHVNNDADSPDCLQYKHYPYISFVDSWCDDNHFIVLNDSYKPKD